MPSGKSAQPLITDNLDGTVTVQYSPTEAGLHEMHIKYNGTHIPGQCDQPHVLIVFVFTICHCQIETGNYFQETVDHYCNISFCGSCFDAHYSMYMFGVCVSVRVLCRISTPVLCEPCQQPQCHSLRSRSELRRRQQDGHVHCVHG